ncbi:DEAD-box ATP-dependent RNA helicase 10-like protein, partial [Drosera capensis]
GVGISLVNQYELEWFVQIEKLIGKKLSKFPAEEEQALLLLERVTEAKRLAQMVSSTNVDVLRLAKHLGNNRLIPRHQYYCKQ